jgi:hypothetical protein
MRKLGFATQQVVDIVDCDPRTIEMWLDRWNSTGTFEPETRSGRPVTLTETDDKKIIQVATQEPFNTPLSIRNQLDLDVSKRSVRRRLDAAGLFGRISRKEFPFTVDHLQQRRAFAVTHADWSKYKWMRVVFADETYISLAGTGQTWSNALLVLSGNQNTCIKLGRNLRHRSACSVVFPTKV